MDPSSPSGGGTSPRRNAWRRATRWVAVRVRALRRRFFKPHPVDFEELLRLGRLADAAYEDRDAILRLCGEDFDAVDVRGIGDMKIRYFIATDEAEGTHLLSVQGTTGLRRALSNLSFLTALDERLGVHVHRGFSPAARRIFDDALPRLRKGFRLRLTGHSFGGAQAVLLGMYFRTAGWPVDGIVTFGQPKVTDGEGQAKFRDLPLLRVVDEDDIVPLMPPFRFLSFGRQYKHLGRELVLLDGPRYAFLEERSAERKWSYSFLGRLKYRDVMRGEIAGHPMSHYLRQIERKREKAVEVPYRRRGDVRDPA